MKKKLILAASLAATALISFAAAPAGAPTTVTLGWSESTNYISGSLSFVLCETTNLALPVSSWTVLTNAPYTNCSPVLGSNGMENFTLSLPVVPGAYFFAVESSNFWGLSLPSNVITTPPPVINPTNFTIELGP